MALPKSPGRVAYLQQRRLLRKRPGWFRRPDAGIDRRSCGASIGAKKVAGRMYPFGPKGGPGAAVPGPSLFCKNDSRFRA
jgi:hypothetical protein